jgi:hypothetical protein
MKTYLKLIVFYLISVVESVLNFLSSLIHCYPKLEWSIGFWALCDGRVFKKVQKRDKVRLELAAQADKLMCKAKALADQYDKEVEDEENA